MHCDYSANHECENEAGMKHFIKHGEILGCAGCCAVCLKKSACEYHCKYVISKENAAPMTRHSPEDKSLAVLYSNLPNNLCTTIRANTEEFAKHMNRSVQEYGQACVNVMNVNAALADRYSGRWAEWCESVGLSTRSATRMVEVGKNILGSAKLAELVQDVPKEKAAEPAKKPAGRKQMLYVYSLFDAAGKLLGKGTARELIDAGLMANTSSVSYAYVHGGVNEKWGVARMTRRLEERVVEPKDAKDVQNRTPYRKTKLKGIPDPTPLQWDVHDLIVYNKLAEKAGKPELSYGFWAVKGKPERP